MINGKPLTVGGAKGLEPTIFVNSITGSTISCDGIVGQEKSKPNPAYRDLPSGYTQLESIVGTGSQTIDLGVSADANTTIELCIVPNTSYTSEYAIFGTLWSASASFLMEYNGKFRFHNGGNYGDLATVTSEETTIKTDSTGVTINGTNYPLSAGTSYSSNNLMLYGVTGTSDKKGHFVTKYLKRWQGTTLTLDLVPCRRNSDNVVSLYDMVNDTFLTPTGTFIGGAEVPASFPYWEFKTSIGTHTIVGQYDGKTATETVVVDAVAMYSVTITYTVFLYNEGDECTDVTGGWSNPVVAHENTYPSPYGGNYIAGFVDNYGKTGTITRTRNSNNLYMSVYSASNCAAIASFYTTNKIDLTIYNTLHIEYLGTGSWLNAVNLYDELYALDQSVSEQNQIANNSIVYTLEYSSTRIEKIIDISNISSSRYVFTMATAYASTSKTSNLTVYKIWLE